MSMLAFVFFWFRTKSAAIPLPLIVAIAFAFPLMLLGILYGAGIIPRRAYVALTVLVIAAFTLILFVVGGAYLLLRVTRRVT
jgi:hypothetical protein